MRIITQISITVYYYCFIIAILLSCFSIKAQNDSIYKNTVKFNMSNHMIYGDGAIVFGYERVLKNNQSFSVHIGTAAYPMLTYNGSDSTLLLHESDYKDKGFHISGDYRFYLKKENKYKAPRGIYIGPYYSYSYFKRTNHWSMNSDSYQGEFQSDITFNLNIVGAQLGYQFVFWKRLSLDMLIMSPGVGVYGLKTKINTTLTEEDEAVFYNALNTSLSQHIPGYSRVINAEDFKESGSVTSVDFGFRYMLLVGFRF